MRYYPSAALIVALPICVFIHFTQGVWYWNSVVITWGSQRFTHSLPARGVDLIQVCWEEGVIRGDLIFRKLKTEPFLGHTEMTLEPWGQIKIQNQYTRLLSNKKPTVVPKKHRLSGQRVVQNYEVKVARTSKLHLSRDTIMNLHTSRWVCIYCIPSSKGMIWILWSFVFLTRFKIQNLD